MSIKNKILDLLKVKLGSDNVKSVDFKETDEFKKAVEQRANELLEQEISKLDQSFLDEVTAMMKPIEVSNEPIKTQEEQVKEILKENKE